ncbi:class I SAM-dependent methyltransferase [Streptomyces sp. MST-110588]|uniref:class I SAM-dependent methyltransferase n=1 Tax=Streptomyces sp. MST-110588 TaxID=2833628 RepID=UPI001F5CDE8B|nr:class I SAM-dependent methyltransferase [Streptomyces sp. MST-110588]UNO43371.1 methyltransferase domain-containing protein [Streptomyces sp. MST-110588]
MSRPPVQKKHAGTRFDALAQDYARMAAENPVRLHSERHTVLEVLGDLRGKTALDMGCGEGRYTRLLRERGAAQVTGIDASEGMLEHARQREREEPRGVRYLRRDAGRSPAAPDPETDGTCDVVVCVYMLPYASTRQELTAMCATARRSLRPEGGRLVTATLNPDVSTEPGWYDHYGYQVLSAAGTQDGTKADGCPYRARIQVGEGCVVLDAYRWSVAAHERALGEAGFDHVTWVRPAVSDEGRRLFGDAYWRNYLSCPQILIADCVAGPDTRVPPAVTDPPEGSA